MADITTIQVKSGDISNVFVSDGDITTISAAPASVTIENDVQFSDATPSDITRAGASGVLNIASRADHVHSVANTLLDGGNY